MGLTGRRQDDILDGSMFRLTFDLISQCIACSTDFVDVCYQRGVYGISGACQPV